MRRSASENVRNLLHLPDSLSAEASEGIGRDSLDVAVLLEVPEHRQRDDITGWLSNTAQPGNPPAGSVGGCFMRRLLQLCFKPVRQRCSCRAASTSGTAAAYVHMHVSRLSEWCMCGACGDLQHEAVGC